MCLQVVDVYVIQLAPLCNDSWVLSYVIILYAGSEVLVLDIWLYWHEDTISILVVTPNSNEVLDDSVV